MWALEANDMNLSCLECNEKLKIARGCNKPGSKYGEGQMGFRTSSPLLHEKGQFLLRECPIGLVLREAPYIYEMLNLGPYVDSGNMGPRDLPRTTQRVLAVSSNERERLRALKRKKGQGKSDSDFGARARSGR